MAWVGAAAQQIESLMRYCLNCLKANWQYANYKRRTRAAVFRQVTD